jgi:hypothetical protein
MKNDLQNAARNNKTNAPHPLRLNVIQITLLYTKPKLVKLSFPPLAGGIEGGGQGDKIDIIPSACSFFITR